MAQTYTQSFGQAVFSAPGGQVMYTASPGETTILRDIVIANLSQAVSDFSVRSAGQAVYFYRGQIPANGSHHEELRQVVIEGDSLIVDGGATSWTATLTGYVLSPQPGRARAEHHEN